MLICLRIPIDVMPRGSFSINSIFIHNSSKHLTMLQDCHIFYQISETYFNLYNLTKYFVCTYQIHETGGIRITVRITV